jgi:serine/threonine-protein kinase
LATGIRETRSALRLGRSALGPGNTGTRGVFVGEYHRLLASRLRVICLFGVVFIPSFFVLDLINAAWVVADLPLSMFAFIRVLAAVFYFLLWVILSNPELPWRTLNIIDLVMFPPTCAVASYIGVRIGGIDTMYYAGVILVVFSRAVLVPGSVPRNVGVLLACFLTYPATAWLVALFSTEVAAQFHDPVRVAGFVSNHIFLLITAMLAGIGAWVLNRLQLQEYRLQRIGRYVIERKLGEGGMGVVYLAKHGVLKRRLAIKLLGSKHPVTDAMRRRFEREAKHTSRLAHPNTIQIFDFGVSEDGLLFYAMEYVEGHDLKRLVDRHGVLPAGRAIHLVAQACRSIHHAHEHGIIHRDVKPENCIVAGASAEPDFLKVLDFGLAKVTRGDGSGDDDAHLSHSGAVMGTPHYMAPELCTGHDVDPRTDVYSLGCLLYFVLTGQPTFRGDSWMEVMLMHTSEPPVPPTRLNPAIPRDLEAVILRCLAKDPAERFPSAAAVGDALLGCAAAGSWTAADAAAWWTDHPAAALIGADGDDDSRPDPTDVATGAGPDSVPFMTTIDFSIAPEAMSKLKEAAKAQRARS